MDIHNSLFLALKVYMRGKLLSERSV